MRKTSLLIPLKRILLPLRSIVKEVPPVSSYSIKKHFHTKSRLLQQQEPVNQVDFGLLFDVDGVLARGTTPLDDAKEAFRKLKDSEGRLKVPVAFVTNACNRSEDKARQISNWFNIKVSPDQVIHAPTPARLLTDLHPKHTLVIGQEHRLEIASSLGFNNCCTIEDLKEAYPLLDMVDHDNRNYVAKHGYTENLNFPRVEAVLCIGEPKLWESNLQLLIDLLLTEGKPTEAPKDSHNVPQLPVVACNMDLVFMEKACMPRFGHGSFLICVEALYHKITGKHLQYKNLVGKPCEITYRYAENTVTKVAKDLGFKKPLKRLYFFGDNPHVDIVGSNLYNRYIRRISREVNGNQPAVDYDIPASRLIPESEELQEQTVEACHSVLVGTGVYKYLEGSTLPHEVSVSNDTAGSTVYHGHRDIAHEPELTKPHMYCHNVNEGIDFVFKKEGLASRSSDSS